MDWREIEVRVFGAEASTAEGTVCLPEDGVPRALRLERAGEGFVPIDDPLEGKVAWRIQHHDGQPMT